MPLPDGLATFTLTGGAFTDATGAVALAGVRGALVPVDGAGRPMPILHPATGKLIVPAAVPITVAGDGTWSVGPLPYTNDPALAGPFRYSVSWNVSSIGATPGDRIIEVPTGSGSVIDFDLMGSAIGSTVTPVAVPLVTSVAGESGAVTTADIAQALDNDGGRLSNATLRAAFASGVVDPLATDSTRLGRWRSGLASRQPRAFILNDSWGDGSGASNWDKSWTRRFAQRLRDRYFPGATHGATYIAAGSSINAATAPVTFTFTGSALDVDYMGIQRRMRQLLTGDTASFTFTGTGFDIHYGTDGTAGSFTYKVDGGSPVTVAAAADPGAAHAEHPGFRQQVRGLTAGTHTIVITSSNDNTFLLGVFVYNGDETTGVRVYEGGRGGEGTSYFLTDTYRWLPEVTTIDPHLVVIALGINDFQAQFQTITSAQFRTNLTTLIAAVRAGTNDPSIVLAVPPQPAGTGLSPWSEFPAAIRDVATADGKIAVFDSTLLLGSSIATSAANPWGYYFDGFHINDAGHQGYADSLFELVTRFP